MPLLDQILRWLGFRKMVLIEGKDFSDLSLSEAAEMIDVHLGLPGRFAPEALYEFYTVPNRGPLEEVRQRVLAIQQEFAMGSEPDGLLSSGGQAALAALAEELRRRDGAADA